MPLLTILLILPLLFAGLIAFLPAASSRTVAVVGASVTFIASLGLLALQGNPDASGFQFSQNIPWIPGLGINYRVGVDGPAILLILLTTFLQLFASLYAYQHPPKENPRAFFALLMVVETAIVGAFCALDLILFYVFFELCLIPIYFLIGMWGNGRRRIAAANKFFIYTVVGSLLMLASIIGLATLAGVHDFDPAAIKAGLAAHPNAANLELLIFAGFAIAFAVKTGVFPLHTWLPDTYAESPVAATVILSGAMAKLGTYGLYRFCIQMMPDAAHVAAPLMVTLAVISIIYGALIAAVQGDLKRVLAYSSISHLGFVVLGLFAMTPTSIEGAFLQMVNHGITAGVLFLIAGMIEVRRGTTSIRQLGGLWEQMPVFGRFFLIATLSSIALPLTNGFVGEFMILIGAFQTHPWATAAATTGVIWSAIYMLYMFQRVMYGPVDKAANRRLRDISGLEPVILGVFVALIFGLGIFPKPALRTLDAAITALPALNAPEDTPPAVATANATTPANHGEGK